MEKWILNFETITMKLDPKSTIKPNSTKDENATFKNCKKSFEFLILSFEFQSHMIMYVFFIKLFFTLSFNPINTNGEIDF